MKRAVVTSLLLGAIVACGASSKRAASPMTSPASETTAPPSETSRPGGADMMNADPHSEISRLTAEIDAQRGQLGLAEPQALPMAPTTAERMSTVPSSTDASCKPAKTERCDGSCKLSDSICTNASRICDLATELPGDGWAAGKCASAKQSCDGAHDKCCSCQ